MLDVFDRFHFIRISHKLNTNGSFSSSTKAPIPGSLERDVSDMLNNCLTWN